MSGNPTHVVALGGGYAGTMATNRLRREKKLQITLVNAHPRFVDRIRLHQFAAAHTDVTASYGAVLGQGMTPVTDNGDHIDTAARTVHLASGRLLAYDYLIYAAGSAGLPGAAVPGAAVPGAAMPGVAMPGVAEFGYLAERALGPGSLDTRRPVTPISRLLALLSPPPTQ